MNFIESTLFGDMISTDTSDDRVHIRTAECIALANAGDSSVRSAAIMFSPGEARLLAENLLKAARKAEEG